MSDFCLTGCHTYVDYPIFPVSSSTSLLEGRYIEHLGRQATEAFYFPLAILRHVLVHSSYLGNLKKCKKKTKLIQIPLKKKIKLIQIPLT